MVAADCRQRERWPKVGVKLDGSFEEIQCRIYSLPVPGQTIGQGTKIEVVARQIVCGARGRSSDFGSLQGGLNDTGDTGRNLILQVEYVFE